MNSAADPTTTTATLPQPGEFIAGKYRVEQVLGMGGMGAVFQVSHRVTQKRFAIKWLLPEHAANDEAAGRLVREAQVAGLFDHPNVVQVYDVGGEHGKASFIVMELLQGETLADRLARVGRLSCEEACKILLPCMNALSAAHAKGIVHRDLKPANIFLCRAEGREAERTKVLDFGIAKLLPTRNGFDPMRTQTGMIMGTPLYMAPEQMRGRPVDPRVDVYAMGVTLYQALSGDMPFSAGTLPELVLKITGEDPEPLDRRVEGLPAGLAELVAYAMTRDPYERIPSMEALMRELAPYRDAPAPPPSAARPQPPAAKQAQAKTPKTLLVAESAAAPHDRSPAARWPWLVAAALSIGVAAFALLRVREQWAPASETTAVSDQPHPASSTHEIRPDSAQMRPRPSSDAPEDTARNSETTSSAASRAPDERQSVEVAASPIIAAQPTEPPEPSDPATASTSSDAPTPALPRELGATATAAPAPKAAADTLNGTQLKAAITATSIAPTPATVPVAATAAPRTLAPQPSAATPPVAATAANPAAPKPAATNAPPAPEPSPAQPEPSDQVRARPRFDLDRTDFPDTKPAPAPLERPKTRLGVGEF